MDKRLSLGINASIILILIIFCVLLSLPLKYLFNTNYKGTAPKVVENSQLEEDKIIEVLEVKDFKKMKICPFNYEIWMKSLFTTSYDENCTRKQTIEENVNVLLVEEEKIEEKLEEVDDEKKVIVPDQSASVSTESATSSKRKEAKDAQKNKSIPVAVHILATMLVVSVIVAIVEVVRIRFARDKDLSTTANITSRRGSIMNFVAQKKEMLKSQRSLDLQAMHRSTRLLGKASLLRRSSFPIQNITKIVESGSGQAANRLSKRPSVIEPEDISGLITNLHHRPHLIRRH